MALVSPTQPAGTIVRKPYDAPTVVSRRCRAMWRGIALIDQSGRAVQLALAMFVNQSRS
jgi:hypothetical protein